MSKEIIELAKKLISIKSIQSNPKGLERALDLSLSQLDGYTIEKFENNGSKSALIYNTKERPEKFKILLNGHLDVIPGKETQYKPYIKGDRLYGVGSMDMKSNVACLLYVFKKISKKINYPLGLQLVTDEEIGGFNGTKYQIGQGVKADFVISAEPTQLDIVYETKGLLRVEIVAKGESAHGAYPWRGNNAIWIMNDFLNRLQSKYPVQEFEKWETTMNLCNINTSNEASNKVPDECKAMFDIRYVPGDYEAVVNRIESLLPEGVTSKVVLNEAATFVDKENAYIKKVVTVAKSVLGREINLRGAHGSSDVRHYTSRGYPGIEFGPVGSGIGSDSEWVDINSLNDYINIMEEMLLKLDSE